MEEVEHRVADQEGDQATDRHHRDEAGRQHVSQEARSNGRRNLFPSSAPDMAAILSTAAGRRNR
jgi:hypothetical protein